eukprot:TRINITY_DN3993_c0_g1_i1.p1 TRINITY_DN3993_c0_g1~~TRINITY_DN3993_c0_g1_i1.p1  ORF type:complete len:533 (+),score=107.64 TRINITY_DN3993_c0_g1_i1:97-1599(+)
MALLTATLNLEAADVSDDDLSHSRGQSTSRRPSFSFMEGAEDWAQDLLGSIGGKAGKKRRASRRLSRSQAGDGKSAPVDNSRGGGKGALRRASHRSASPEPVVQKSKRRVPLGNAKPARAASSDAGASSGMTSSSLPEVAPKPALIQSPGTDGLATALSQDRAASDPFASFTTGATASPADCHGAPAPWAQPSEASDSPFASTPFSGPAMYGDVRVIQTQLLPDKRPPSAPLMAYLPGFGGGAAQAPPPPPARPASPPRALPKDSPITTAAPGEKRAPAAAAAPPPLLDRAQLARLLPDEPPWREHDADSWNLSQSERSAPASLPLDRESTPSSAAAALVVPAPAVPQDPYVQYLNGVLSRYHFDRLRHGAAHAKHDGLKAFVNLAGQAVPVTGQGGLPGAGVGKQARSMQLRALASRGGRCHPSSAPAEKPHRPHTDSTVVIAPGSGGFFGTKLLAGAQRRAAARHSKDTHRDVLRRTLSTSHHRTTPFDRLFRQGVFA